MTRFPDPIPGIIPFGTLSIFAGAPAVGKTTMLVDWIHRWLDGRTIWGHTANAPTRFYYVAADRGQTEEQFYAKAGEANRAHITFYSVVHDAAIDPENFHKDQHGSQLLSYVLGQLQPIPGSHVILDPLAPLFIHGNQNRSRDVAASLVKMSRRLAELHINITGICHFAKQKADKNDRYRRPQDRISGSGAFSGFSDTQIYLVDPEPPRIPYYVLGWNPRYSPPQEFKCTREEWFKPWRGLDEVGVDRETDRPTQLAEMIPDEGIRPADLIELACDEFDCSPRTVFRDIATLLDRGTIRKDEQTGKLYKRAVS